MCSVLLNRLLVSRLVKSGVSRLLLPEGMCHLQGLLLSRRVPARGYASPRAPEHGHVTSADSEQPQTGHALPAKQPPPKQASLGQEIGEGLTGPVCVLIDALVKSVEFTEKCFAEERDRSRKLWEKVFGLKDEAIGLKDEANGLKLELLSTYISLRARNDEVLRLQGLRNLRGAVEFICSKYAQESGTVERGQQRLLDLISKTEKFCKIRRVIQERLLVKDLDWEESYSRMDFVLSKDEHGQGDVVRIDERLLSSPVERATYCC